MNEHDYMHLLMLSYLISSLSHCIEIITDLFSWVVIMFVLLPRPFGVLFVFYLSTTSSIDWFVSFTVRDTFRDCLFKCEKVLCNLANNVRHNYWLGLLVAFWDIEAFTIWLVVVLAAPPHTSFALSLTWLYVGLLSHLYGYLFCFCVHSRLEDYEVMSYGLGLYLEWLLHSYRSRWGVWLCCEHPSRLVRMDRLPWISDTSHSLELEDFTPHIVEGNLVTVWVSFHYCETSIEWCSNPCTFWPRIFFLLSDDMWGSSKVRKSSLVSSSKRVPSREFAIRMNFYLHERSILISIPYISPELFISNLLIDCIKSKSNISVLLYLFDFTECRRSGSLHSECSWVNTCFHLECFHYLFGILWMSLQGYCCEGLDRLFDWLDCSYHLLRLSLDWCLVVLSH